MRRQLVDWCWYCSIVESLAYQSVVGVEKEARFVVLGVDHAGDVLHVDDLLLTRP